MTKISFKVDIDKLNLDRYVKNSTGTEKTEASKEEDVNLSALKSINLNGVIRIDALQVKNLHITQVHLPIKAAQGEFAMNGITAQLYQGDLAGSMGFAVEGNRFQMQQILIEVAVYQNILRQWLYE